MMSKFKQLRLRLVVAVAVLLMAGMGTEAFAQCYTKNLQQAESLYKQGRYAEAKKRFAAAKACPDKPKTNNLDSRIAACNRKIKERAVAARSRRAVSQHRRPHRGQTRLKSRACRFATKTSTTMCLMPMASVFMPPTCII